MTLTIVRIMIMLFDFRNKLGPNAQYKGTKRILLQKHTAPFAYVVRKEKASIFRMLIKYPREYDVLEEHLGNQKLLLIVFKFCNILVIVLL